MQVGIVIRDIEATAQKWAAVLGVPIPEIITTDPVEVAHTEYHQRATPARAKLAFFELGQVTLELIEPIGEPSTWHDGLAPQGGGLHHIAFEIKGMGDTIRALADEGLPLLQRGDYEGGRYAYIDGSDQLGAIIELLEND